MDLFFWNMSIDLLTKYFHPSKPSFFLIHRFFHQFLSGISLIFIHLSERIPSLNNYFKLSSSLARTLQSCLKIDECSSRTFFALQECSPTGAFFPITHTAAINHGMHGRKTCVYFIL